MTYTQNHATLRFAYALATASPAERKEIQKKLEEELALWQRDTGRTLPTHKKRMKVTIK